jgi:hypothetical protein
MNDKYLHNIGVGDLVKIRSDWSGRLAVVLAIEPFADVATTAAHHMREVEVLIESKQRAFIMYELEKVG